MTQTDRIADTLKKSADLFKAKNSDYGDSWKKAGYLLHMMIGEVTLKRDSDHLVFGVLTRMLDKMNRTANLAFKADRPKVKESVGETLRDLGIYAFMLADEIEQGIPEAAASETPVTKAKTDKATKEADLPI